MKQHMSGRGRGRVAHRLAAGVAVSAFASTGVAVVAGPAHATAPTTTASSVSFSADTGTSASDFVTRTAAQTISGTLSANLLSGESVWVSLDNGGSWTQAAAAVGTSAWSLAGATLAGSNVLKVRVENVDGPGAASSQAYVYDSTPPAASITTDHATLRAGETATVTFTFSEDPGLTFSAADVTVSGGTLGSISGSGAIRTATFTPTAGSQGTAGLEVGAGSYADVAGNAGTVAALSQAYDTSAPSVTSVGVPADGTYHPGEALDLSVSFSEPVTVDTSGGDPSIALTIGSGTAYATYLAGSGTGTVTFRHTITPGEVDADGITVGALSANGSTLRDAAGNDAALTLNSVGSTAAVLVAARMPQITAFDSTPPVPAYVGAQYTLVAHDGGSGNPVTYSSTTTAVCTVSGAQVTFLAPGTCSVRADQAASSDYLAGSATQAFTVVAAPVVVPPAPVDPAVTSSVTAPTPAANGWYRGPVRITFACTAGSAPLSDACPAPVTLGDGMDQYVTRTVLGTDGGATTVTYGPFSIDTTAPSTWLVGVPTATALLTGEPNVSCAATDATSGLADCQVRATSGRGSVTYVATAHDRAGNAAVVRQVVRLPRQAYAIAGAATSQDGTLTLSRGRTYTVVVLGAKRPRFVGAHAPAHRFHHAGAVGGVRRWAVRVSIDRHARRGSAWELRVRTGRHTLVIRTRIR